MRLIATCFILAVLGVAEPLHAQEEIPEPKPAKSCSVEKTKLSTSDILKQINSEIEAGQARNSKPATREKALAGSDVAAPSNAIVPVAAKPASRVRKPTLQAAPPPKPAKSATVAKVSRKKKHQPVSGFY